MASVLIVRGPDQGEGEDSLQKAVDWRIEIREKR